MIRILGAVWHVFAMLVVAVADFLTWAWFGARKIDRQLRRRPGDRVIRDRFKRVVVESYRDANVADAERGGGFGEGWR